MSDHGKCGKCEKIATWWLSWSAARLTFLRKACDEHFEVVKSELEATIGLDRLSTGNPLDIYQLTQAELDTVKSAAEASVGLSSQSGSGKRLKVHRLNQTDIGLPPLKSDTNKMQKSNTLLLIIVGMTAFLLGILVAKFF